MAYTKHYIALESSPEIFTALIHKLGVSDSLEFRDVLSIYDPVLLGMIPRPVLALILVFPTTKVYEMQVAKEEASRAEYDGSGDQEDIIWFRQTINNACGLYGILHAVCNGRARKFIGPGSILASILATCTPLPPYDRALVLEASENLEMAYREASLRGQSAVPADAEDEVDYHYVCFVNSHKNDHLYEMDGDKKGPVEKDIVVGEDGDVLCAAVGLVEEFFGRENGSSDTMAFSLMALVHVDRDIS